MARNFVMEFCVHIRRTSRESYVERVGLGHCRQSKNSQTSTRRKYGNDSINLNYETTMTDMQNATPNAINTSSKTDTQQA